MFTANHLLADRQRLLNRRWFLRDCGVGLGAIALNGLLSGAEPKTHHPAKAKRVIYLFMGGAPSHLELFDDGYEESYLLLGEGTF